MPRREWGDTAWRRLGDGTVVNVHADDEPHQVVVALSDGTSRSYSFAARDGTSVLSVTVDGSRYTRTAEKDFDDQED